MRARLFVAAVACLAALVFIPPVVYQSRHFFQAWHDVGLYSRVCYNLIEHGRLGVFSDGTPDVAVSEHHFVPFFAALSLPVHLFGANGFVGATTLAMVAAAMYMCGLATSVCRSRELGVWCAVAFIANPYSYACVLGYHVETFAILWLFAFAYHAYNAQMARAWIALTLALLVKEDMSVYVILIAVMVARPGRLRSTVAFVAAAIAYDVAIVGWLGSRLYPTGNFFGYYYGIVMGHVPSKTEMILLVVKRWRDFLPLLLSGAGGTFLLSIGFLTVFSPWRFLLACGVMLIWLTFPGGPPRTDFEFYYSYAVLMVSFVALPFGLNGLRVLVDRLSKRGDGGSWSSLTARLAMSTVLIADLAMHVPGLVPPAIAGVVDPRQVFGRGSGVNTAVVRPLIQRHLNGNRDSVLAQFFTFPAIAYRREMYLTMYDRGRLLTGQLQPTWVLIDLHAPDPYVPAEDDRAIAAYLRAEVDYQAVYDFSDVLLYRRKPR